MRKCKQSMTQRLSSVKIILYLLSCVFVFYAVYFALASIIYAIYSMEDFDGKIPFDFKHWFDVHDCCERQEMVNMLSMVVTFPVCGAIFGSYIPRWVWDFCLTTTVLHIILSCIVMLDVPRNWTWWLTIGSSCIFMIGAGEMVWHLLDWRRRRRLVIPESIVNEQTSYYHR